MKPKKKENDLNNAAPTVTPPTPNAPAVLLDPHALLGSGTELATVSRLKDVVSVSGRILRELLIGKWYGQVRFVKRQPYSQHLYAVADVRKALDQPWKDGVTFRQRIEALKQEHETQEALNRKNKAERVARERAEKLAAAAAAKAEEEANPQPPQSKAPKPKQQPSKPTPAPRPLPPIYAARPTTPGRMPPRRPSTPEVFYSRRANR